MRVEIFQLPHEKRSRNGQYGKRLQHAPEKYAVRLDEVPLGGPNERGLVGEKAQFHEVRAQAFCCAREGLAIRQAQKAPTKQPSSAQADCGETPHGERIQ
jgi:hypothetical protein